MSFPLAIVPWREEISQKQRIFSGARRPGPQTHAPAPFDTGEPVPTKDIITDMVLLVLHSL
jgi:hypothetical protein